MESKLGAPDSASTQAQLRRLPSVSEVDRHLAARGLPHGKPVRGEVLAVLEGHRQAVLGGADAPERGALLAAVEQRLQRPPANQLRRVINATGVVVHTNLGRAVLSPAVLQDALPLASHYTNLEFDLETGRRGARGGRVPELLAQLAEAEAALVVNNNAAAVLLMLTALAAGGEVIVSRGELVEIGGAFRVPDIMRLSGVRLVEVGTTNRTRVEDYAQAITPETVALLKVHPSNFVMTGFTEEATVSELAALGRERGLPVWNDLGSGNFYRFEQPALRALPTVAQEVRAGADLVTLSGDKLLGAVQAGIVVGKREAVQTMQRHPLYRSLRLDKLRLAVLERALLDYLDIPVLRANNRVVAMLERTPDDMQPLAERVLAALRAQGRGRLQGSIVREESLAGGGAVPEVRIATVCLAIERQGADGEQFSVQLRRHDPPIIARVQEGRVLLDFRTILEDDLPHLEHAVAALAQLP
jgi:L-seryl-tRNA(Ser) seleniumtransferase